ncbi:hypothetical protein B0H34DRAFT_224749 [Crassisporium funariophilum]|nr:hypothetical protein B0H34DRAFT_224749 [Crassisporium funariophilum]
MASTPREIGTLIVVILRANHLPNKKNLGKQDPYCAVLLNGERRRTKAIRRGGQHPEWDEEVRFTLLEDVTDVLARTLHENGTPRTPSKDDRKPKKIKGGKIMKLACFADDPREPELIGETEVDLDEVLTKGETDEWFTLTNKDKFAGKIKLELTFWSNEPAPKKKITSRSQKNNEHYAGPGLFVPSGDTSASSLSSKHASSTSPSYDLDLSRSGVIPSSLRSSAYTKPELYVAPYERSRNSNSPMENLAQAFSASEVSRIGLREPLLAQPETYRPQSRYSIDYSTPIPFPLRGYDDIGLDIPNTHASAMGAAYETQHHREPPSETVDGCLSRVIYDTNFPALYQRPAPSPERTPSVSSGFMPLSQDSGPPHMPERNGTVPPLPHYPPPLAYTPQFLSQAQPVYALSLPQTPTTHSEYHPRSNSLSFQAQDYSNFAIAPQTMLSPPQMHSAQSLSYGNLTRQDSLSVPGQRSRPLPQEPNIHHFQPNLLPSYPSPLEAFGQDVSLTSLQPTNGFSMGSDIPINSLIGGPEHRLGHPIVYPRRHSSLPPLPVSLHQQIYQPQPLPEYYPYQQRSSPQVSSMNSSVNDHDSTLDTIHLSHNSSLGDENYHWLQAVEAHNSFF